MYLSSSCAYCYHSLNVISLVESQTDNINQMITDKKRDRERMIRQRKKKTKT
jgi:hypothetical protein